MNLKQLMDMEVNPEKKSNVQIKALKALAAFLVIMVLLTLLSRAADSLTIAKVTVTGASSQSIAHNIEADGTVEANRDLAVSTTGGIKLASVEAVEGTTVKAGDLLFLLDTDDLKKQLLKAQKELDVLNATASDKRANDAIAASEKQKNIDRAYEDYDETIDQASEAVSEAKEEMNKAYKAYEDYLASMGQTPETDPTVADSLQKTIDEKSQLYDEALSHLDDVQKQVDYDSGKEIDEAIKAASVDEEGNPKELTDSEKQAIISEIMKKYQPLIDEAQKLADEAKAVLDKAQNALTVYRQEQAEAARTTDDEQLQTLLADFEAKEKLYDEAVESYYSTKKTADRSLQDLYSPETVDTASKLTENDEKELKELQVKELQALMDKEGKVTAPSDGLITKVLVTTGDVTPEGTAVRMADQSSGYVFKTSLDKSQAQYLKAGDKITLVIGNDVTVQNLPISKLEVSAEDKNTYYVTADIPSKVTKISNFATLKVEKQSQRYYTCVPLSALHSDGKEYYVYTLAEKNTVLGSELSAVKVPVQIQDKNSTMAAIDGAFAWDERFILTSSKALRDKDRVRVLEESSGGEE